MRTPPSRTYHQQGAALVVSLLFLVVLTLIGIGAMGTSGLELLMAGNTKLQGDALTKAESTLVAAQSSLDGNTIDPAQPGYYHYMSNPLPASADISKPIWWTTYETIHADPEDQYVVEDLGCNSAQAQKADPYNAICVYRITVHSAPAASKGAERIIQAAYATSTHINATDPPIVSAPFSASDRYSWVELYAR